MLYEFDRNWLDYEAMFSRYGEGARYREKTLASIVWASEPFIDMGDHGDEDYSPAERRQMVIDDLETRRAGEAIYQRGR
jgi:hypothetical protein